MLLGVSDSFFEVGECSKGDFHIRTVLCDRNTNFIWNLVIIYGAPDNKGKADFLIELVHILGYNNMPIVIGGDFNIIRNSSERNKQKRTSK